MARASLLGVVVLFATAASADPVGRQPTLADADLLSGEVLALPPSLDAFALPSADDAFQLDAAMHAFIAPFATVRDQRQRLYKIIEGLQEHGLFAFDYSDVTRTASATFHDRRGNCLSFTMLFVGLARAAGLTATYQSVEVPPTWSNDGQVVIASHVNAVVRIGYGDETVVDFNVRASRDERSRRVSDSYALGLFYINLGAEALIRGEHAATLTYLREAARVHPNIAGLWVNLGVLYARHGRYEHAEAAYLRALAIDEREQSALANLVIVYQVLGKPELVQEYHDRVQAYRERNPYYHYAMATRAYEQQQFATALTALRRALRLKHDEQDFHVLRGEALAALGRSREAQNSFARAREFATVENAGNRSRIGFEDP